VSFDRHQAGQAEVELVGDDLAARGEVHGLPIAHCATGSTT